MGRLIVNEFLSLDGVAQGPGGAEEDPSGGFSHGGWHMKYTADEAGQRWVNEYLSRAGGFLLGRRTYEIFAGYWPNAPREEKSAAEPLNSKRKYVVSRTLREPLEWQNSVVVKGDLAEAITALKQAEEAEIHVIGSTELVRGLVEDNLVDEFRLMIDPVVVGGGKRVFPEDGRLMPLRLIAHEVTVDGALLLSYVPIATGAAK